MKTIDISWKKLKSLPKDLPRTFDGHFYCDHNELTSLKGSPTVVTGSFYCSYNKLTNLKGAPRIVTFFYCWKNILISLDFLPLKYKTVR